MDALYCVMVDVIICAFCTQNESFRITILWGSHGKDSGA